MARGHKSSGVFRVILRIWSSSRLAYIHFHSSTAVYAIEGIGIVLPVENKMKHPQHFLHRFGVLNTAICSITILYNITGFFGYALYGEETKGSITLNLPNDQM